MKEFLLFCVSAGLALCAEINIPLTIQETLYPGSTRGVDRTQEPLSVGIPLPDDENRGLSDVDQLTLSGADVGQFRVLGRWPSGRVKWLLVDTQATLKAGSLVSDIVVKSGGSGNFGGPNLADDRGTDIVVSTGPGTFTIRKAHFNVFHEATVGSKALLRSGASEGLVVTGPAPGETACPCTTVYSSTNDPASTAVIEENGPARAVIRASGRHVDANGNVYMRFTVRMHFYRGKSYVRLVSVLRNADYGRSGSFETAFKGHQGYEVRLAAALEPPLKYRIANHTVEPSVGTLDSGGSAFLYQGDSQLMKHPHWCGSGCIPFTHDKGYRIEQDGSVLAQGTEMQYPYGWADIEDSQGTGIQIGAYQLAAYGPKSLEFNAGGADVRIGLWARQNSQPYYQPWPQWSIHEAFVNFHDTTLTEPGEAFLRFQHALVARAPRTHYNETRVFPYPLIDPAEEDAFYMEVVHAANPRVAPSRGCCLRDLGILTPAIPSTALHATRFYYWGAGGGGNQAEFRWSSLLNYLSRGYTGRYLEAAHFYRFQAEMAWPHSDDFNWRERPGFGRRDSELDGFGRPTATSANSDKGFRAWLGRDAGEHSHWYGMTDYYFLSGDETIRDALLDGTKDWFLNRDTYQNGLSPGLWSTRAIGAQLIGAARFYHFLSAIGDPDAFGVLAQGVASFDAQVKSDLCASGYPEGCDNGGIEGGIWKTQGISRVRGVHFTARGGSTNWCGVPHRYRIAAPFVAGILLQGIWELRAALGPRWPDYDQMLDLAYALSTWSLTEAYADDGTGRWNTNGFRYYVAIDAPSECDASYAPRDNQTIWFPFFVQHAYTGLTEWAPKFRIALQRLMASLGMTTADFGQIHIAAVIDRLLRPGTVTLTDVPVTGFSDEGGGSYKLSWTVPEGARRYRIKWAAKPVVDWIGFDAGTNVFLSDPAAATAWFAAANVPDIPPPANPGETQSLRIETGVSGLTQANFRIKAYVDRAAASDRTRRTATIPRPAVPPAVRVASAAAPGAGQIAPAATKARRTSGTEDPALPAIAWQKQSPTPGWPGYVGWQKLLFDPVSKQTILYGILNNSGTIYSTDLFFYDSGSNQWTHLPGTGSLANDCAAGGANWPSNRHPYGQMAIDTRRNVLWLRGGVCAGARRQDMWYLKLNANPIENTWHEVKPAHLPPYIGASMEYDPDNDVLFSYGYDGGPSTRNNWVYCSTMDTETPGVLTPQQVVAGCTAPDDWTEVSVAGGVQPKAIMYAGMVYDPVTKKMILYGGEYGYPGIPQNETWAYDVPTRTWTQKALSTEPPPAYERPHTVQPPLIYNTASKTILYHQTSGSGSPADWEYSPERDVWSRITSTGGGPTSALTAAYDSARNVIVGLSYANYRAEVWQGELLPRPEAPAPTEESVVQASRR